MSIFYKQVTRKYYDEMPSVQRKNTLFFIRNIDGVSSSIAFGNREYAQKINIDFLATKEELNQLELSNLIQGEAKLFGSNLNNGTIDLWEDDSVQTPINFPFNVAVTEPITPQIKMGYTFSNEGIISPFSDWSINMYLTSIETNRIYNFKAVLTYITKGGVSTILSENKITRGFLETNPLVSIPLTENKLLKNIDRVSGDKIIIEIYIWKNAGNTDVVNIVCTNENNSYFVRNGGDTNSTLVFDFDGENTTTQYERNRNYETKFLGIESEYPKLDENKLIPKKFIPSLIYDDMVTITIPKEVYGLNYNDKNVCTDTQDIILKAFGNGDSVIGLELFKKLTLHQFIKFMGVGCGVGNTSYLLMSGATFNSPSTMLYLFNNSKVDIDYNISTTQLIYELTIAFSGVIAGAPTIDDFKSLPQNVGKNDNYIISSYNVLYGINPSVQVFRKTNIEVGNFWVNN